ncbi:MAG: DinB family protein [Acidobacteriia bacterium]|nr:DinB family protein [Terriglobia bacterium]
MTYYGPKEIAASFRNVRKNTLTVAADIPGDKYGFEPAPGARTVAQTLIHIANIPRFQFALHRDSKLKSLAGFDFQSFIGPIQADEQKARSKDEIIQRLRDGGEEFASWVASLSDDFLGEVVTMPPGGQPPSRTRFDMIISVKEHEMHHRGQLMLVERMLGIVPHLTRDMQARMAQMQAAASQGQAGKS